MAELFKGAPVAAALTENLRSRCDELKNKGTEPCLAIVRVGEKAGDISYETGAMKRCEKIGIRVKNYILPSAATTEEILNVVNEINEDRKIHGCLFLRPLANKEAEAEASRILSERKDMDCMTDGSLVTVFKSRGDGYAPCTAEAVMEILDYYGIELKGKRVTVIGRSLVIGKPVSMMLQARHATVTMCHTRTVNLEEECRQAEILVAAAGHIGTVTKECVTEGQIVIDVGINVTEEGKLTGDVEFEAVEPIVKAITPVPGGVGSVTTAVLCKHVIEAAEKQ